jgi:hypothetical protein
MTQRSLIHQALQEASLTPFPTHQRPNRSNCVTLQNECAEILLQIPSTLGPHGHVHLICRPNTQDWDSRTNTAPPVVESVFPGPVPIIPAGSTQLEERGFVRVHEAELNSYHTQQEAKSVIRNKIIQACPNHIQTLRNEQSGYANVTPAQMIAHVFTTYGTTTDAMIAANLARLEEPFNPNTEQIEVLFNRMDTVQRFAADEDPISNRTLIRHATSVLTATGEFSEAHTRWTARPVMEQTWNNFKTHFTTAFVEFVNSGRHQQNRTAAQAGYHGAHAAQNPPPGNENIQDLNSYCAHCWSHGLSFNVEHTSLTCRAKAPGHQDTATPFNMQGGCARLLRRRNEEAVYVFNRRPNNTRNANGNNQAQE